MNEFDCKACGIAGEGYGTGPDPCWGELTIISACCGHGREINHVNLRDQNGRVYHAVIHWMSGTGEVVGAEPKIARVDGWNV